MIPRLDSVWPMRAPSLSSLKWQAMAISQPPPRAWPFMAAITGLGKRSIFRSTFWPKRMKLSRLPPEKPEPRSAPAQKMRSPAPVMMTARTASSLARPLNASSRSRISSALMALAGGRFRVMTANVSSRATSSVSYDIVEDSSQEDRGYGVGRLGQPIAALAQHPRRRHLIHGAEQHLGRDLGRHVPADLAGGHSLLENGLDEREVGGDLVGRGAAEELVALSELDLHHLGQIGMLLQHAEVQEHEFPEPGHGIRLAGDLPAHEFHPGRHLLPEQGDEDVVLGAEVEIDGAAGDARL